MTIGEFAGAAANAAVLKRTDAEHRDFARQLAAEKARLIAAQAVAKVGSWENDLATSAVTWSDETHRIFGTTPATFTPTHEKFLGRVHPEDRERVDAAFSDSIGRSGTHTVDHRVLLPGGAVKFVEERWTTVLDERGIPVRAVGTTQDITERTLAERALRDSEQRFASAFEDAPIGMALVSLEGRWLMVNEASCEMLGYSKVELLTGKVQDLTYPDDLKVTQQRLDSAADREVRSFHFRKRFKHALGHVITATVTTTLVRDADGTPRYFVSQIQDITERERSEMALSASEAKFRTLAEAIPQMVWIALADGSNVYLNRTWIDYTGLTFDESLGAGWMKPFHPDDAQLAWDAWKDASAAGRAYSVECRLRAADGAYRWWLVRGVPRRDDSGSVIEWIGTCTDIHDMKRAQLEFTRVNRALKLVIAASSAVIQKKSEADFLAEICRIAVDVGGYALGWIGFAADDDAKSITPMACEGTGDAYLNAPKTTWDENALSGQGPAGMAIRTGEMVVSDGFGIDPTLEPWRAGAANRGFAGVIALPLRNSKRTYGVLVLCSTLFDPPNEEELDLLKNLAGGVAFGINNLRSRG